MSVDVEKVTEFDSAVISLESFVIKEMSLKCSSPNPNSAQPMSLNIGCKSRIRSHTHDPNKFLLSTEYNISPKNKYGWWITAIIEGYLICNPSLPEEQRRPAAILFGHTLLWGTLRGYLIGITAPYPLGAFMLPTIDMGQLLGVPVE